MRRLVLTALLVALGALLWAPPLAHADIDEERALAERYGPVVRLVGQSEECVPGEPYPPMDVDLLFGEPTLALRGPWSGSDLVAIAPEAADLEGRFEYRLAFPGEVFAAGCTSSTGCDASRRTLFPPSTPTSRHRPTAPGSSRSSTGSSTPSTTSTTPTRATGR